MLVALEQEQADVNREVRLLIERREGLGSRMRMAESAPRPIEVHICANGFGQIQGGKPTHNRAIGSSEDSERCPAESVPLDTFGSRGRLSVMQHTPADVAKIHSGPGAATPIKASERTVRVYAGHVLLLGLVNSVDVGMRDKLAVTLAVPVGMGMYQGKTPHLLPIDNGNSKVDCRISHHPIGTMNTENRHYEQQLPYQ